MIELTQHVNVLRLISERSNWSILMMLKFPLFLFRRCPSPFLSPDSFTVQSFVTNLNSTSIKHEFAARAVLHRNWERVRGRIIIYAPCPFLCSGSFLCALHVVCFFHTSMRSIHLFCFPSDVYCLFQRCLIMSGFVSNRLYEFLVDSSHRSWHPGQAAASPLITVCALTGRFTQSIRERARSLADAQSPFCKL